MYNSSHTVGSCNNCRISAPGRHLPDQLVVDDAGRPAAGHEALQDVVGVQLADSTSETFKARPFPFTKTFAIL
jgi:hypothetical protein